MNAPDELTNGDLLALRINEVIVLALGAAEIAELPEWVLRAGARLWAELTPRGTPLPPKDHADCFACGLFLGGMRSEPMAARPHEEVVRQAVVHAAKLGKAEEVERMMERLKSGDALGTVFSRDDLGQILSDFIALPPAKRITFANGFLIGSKLGAEIGNPDFGRGGSPRRTVLLVLWLNWPAMDAMDSVAAIYARLATSFEQAGLSATLGDWERFKKIAQSIGLRVRRRRKGKS